MAYILLYLSPFICNNCSRKEIAELGGEKKMQFFWIFNKGNLLMTIGYAALGLSIGGAILSCGGVQSTPTLVIAEKWPYNVAVVFADDFASTQGDHYTVNDALQTGLFNCVADIYQNVAEEFGDLREGEYDRIIRFSLKEIVRDEHNRRLANVTDPNLPSRYIPLRYKITVAITSYDGESLEPINTEVVKGIGESSDREGLTIREGTGIASSSDPDSFDRAINEAIQNVCDDVTKHLMRGFAEPEKKETPHKEEMRPSR
jgi:hypothetical protein